MNRIPALAVMTVGWTVLWIAIGPPPLLSWEAFFVLLGGMLIRIGTKMEEWA